MIFRSESTGELLSKEVIAPPNVVWADEGQSKRPTSQNQLWGHQPWLKSIEEVAWW